MNLSSPIDYTLLQNKFLNLVVVLWFWGFGRSRDQNESGGSGIGGEFVSWYVHDIAVWVVNYSISNTIVLEIL